MKRVSYDRPLSKLREMVNAGLFDGDMDDYNALEKEGNLELSEPTSKKKRLRKGCDN